MDIPYIMQKYVTFDKPIPYKDLLIHPIPLTNYYDFVACYDILDIDKNSLGEIEIIQMSYLQFLYNLFQQTEVALTKFVTIMEICFNIDTETNQECLNIFINEKGKVSLKIKDTMISAKEFDEIRKIILYQNIEGYDDSYIDPDVKKAADDYYRLSNRGVIMPTLEEKIAKVTAKNGMSKKEILNMTYRGFNLLFNSIVEIVDYTINKTASMSGMVEFKQPIEHWIYKHKKNKFEDVFLGVDTYRDKLKNVI